MCHKTANQRKDTVCLVYTNSWHMEYKCLQSTCKGVWMGWYIVIGLYGIGLKVARQQLGQCNAAASSQLPL